MLHFFLVKYFSSSPWLSKEFGSAVNFYARPAKIGCSIIANLGPFLNAFSSHGKFFHHPPAPPPPPSSFPFLLITTCLWCKIYQTMQYKIHLWHSVSIWINIHLNRYDVPHLRVIIHIIIQKFISTTSSSDIKGYIKQNQHFYSKLYDFYESQVI